MKKIAYFFIAILLSTSAYADCTIEYKSNLKAKGSIIIDTDAKLVWTRCALGMIWQENKKTCFGQPQGFTHDEAINAAKALGPGWRLPTGEEMEYLLKNTCDGILTHHKLFPNLVATDEGDGANFWTSSQEMPGYYYYFDVANGIVDYHSTNFSLTVLAVKPLNE